jgi:hypothetical protein
MAPKKKQEEVPAGGIPVKLSQGVPDKTVRIKDGAEIHHGEGDDRTVYTGGQEVTMSGPSADDLVLEGYADYID